jgi:putative ABC transport system permease protein
MLILKIAFRNICRNTRKTILLGTLIALGMAFLFFANAVFESADQGVRTSFVGSLTGDVVMASESDTPFSLFGNEIPVIDDYEVIPSIPGYADISESFGSLDYAASYTPVVSGAAGVEVGEYRGTAAVFGIVPESYFAVCSDIEVVSGNPADIAEGGIFLCQMIKEEAEKKLKRPLEIGEEVKLSLYSNGSFKIRKGKYAGCHSYINHTAPFDAIILADPTIVRGLIDYTAGNILAETENKGETSEAADDFDLDDIFAQAEDTEKTEEESFSLDKIESILADTTERDALSQVSSSAWSFVLFKAKDGQEKQLKKELALLARDNHWNVEIKGWRQGAGLSAQMVFALKAAFNVGILFIIIGAVLVIVNALVISVLERSYEIGTMRGIGAGKPFISALFIAESMMLTLTAATIGIIIGAIASAVFSGGIPLHNSLLITMFGGDVLCPVVTFKNIALHFAGAALVGALSWIYPVSLAVKIQPVMIMGRG